jgi:Protein of unknown function (DUF3631)
MGLASLLRPYGVKPQLIRQGESVGRGYRRAEFEDVWPRYLPGDISSGEPVTTEAATGPLRSSHAEMRGVTGATGVTASERDTEPEKDELAWR